MPFRWPYVLIGLAGVAFACLSVVNATRIERLRLDVLSIGSRPYDANTSESLLMRDSSGAYMPKAAYWVKAAASQPDPAEPGGPRELALVSDASGDGALLDADVARGRVKFVYRPDQREMFSIEKRDGKLLVKSTIENSSTSLVAAGLRAPTSMTLVGVPASAIHAKAI